METLNLFLQDQLFISLHRVQNMNRTKFGHQKFFSHFHSYFLFLCGRRKPCKEGAKLGTFSVFPVFSPFPLMGSCINDISRYTVFQPFRSSLSRVRSVRNGSFDSDDCKTPVQNNARSDRNSSALMALHRHSDVSRSLKTLSLHSKARIRGGNSC
jgi:hypothetical protein